MPKTLRKQILNSQKRTHNWVDIYGNDQEPLAKPAHTRAMIQKDPDLAATVLGTIRPRDFDAGVGMNLQDFLPRGRGALAV